MKERKKHRIRRNFIKSSLFGGVFLLSTLFTSFSSKALVPLSLEDLIEKYADELIDMVFASYPGAGSIVDKVKAAIKTIQESFEGLFDTEQEHSIKEAAGLAMVGDSLNEVTRTFYNSEIMNRARMTAAGCTSHEAGIGLEEIVHNAKKLQSNAAESVAKKTVKSTQSETVKTIANNVVYTLQNSSEGVSDAQFQSSAFLSRLGYQDQAARNRAAQYIENVLSPLSSTYSRDGFSIGDSPNASERAFYVDTVSKTAFLSVLSDALHSIYAARVRSQNTERSAREGLSGDELAIVDKFANAEGLSKVDMMEVNLQRILSNEKAYNDMRSVQEHIHPNVTTSLKYVLPALASKNQIQAQVVNQLHIINRLKALDLL